MNARWAVVMGLLLAIAGGASDLGAEEACGVPAGAVAGDLTLESCTYTGADGVPYPADCGALIVPENRDDPDTRLLALPVTRIPAAAKRSAEAIF